MIFKNTLSISANGISWKGNHYGLDAITRVRWGCVSRSLNGIPFGTDYTIALGDNKSETEIFLRSKKIYSAFIAKLWKAVCVRLILDVLKRVVSGEEIEFGTAIHKVQLKNDGITLKHNFRSGVVLTQCSWQQIYAQSFNGAFHIGTIDNKKTYVGLPYIGIPNAHIFEQIIRMVLNRPSINLLSELLDE